MRKNFYFKSIAVVICLVVLGIRSDAEFAQLEGIAAHAGKEFVQLLGLGRIRGEVRRAIRGDRSFGTPGLPD